MSATTCGRCDGKGSWTALCVLRWNENDEPESGPSIVKCFRCKGSGIDPFGDLRPAWVRGGLAIRAGRRERGEGLGDMARRVGVTVVELSEMERGEREPSINALWASL